METGGWEQGRDQGISHLLLCLTYFTQCGNLEVHPWCCKLAPYSYQMLRKDAYQGGALMPGDHKSVVGDCTDECLIRKKSFEQRHLDSRN